MQDGTHFTATQLVRAGISQSKQCCDCAAWFKTQI